MKKNIAIILFNIGGPENLNQVKKYLFNFFSDKFIIRAPYLIRKMIAFLISTTRSSKTKSIYSKIGGKSVSKENTLMQAQFLEKILNESSDEYSFKTYISMSYWHPMAEKTILDLELDQKKIEGGFKQIIHLPLYPQFSTTSTGSSFFYWNQLLNKTKSLNEIKKKYICCYFNENSFIEAHAENLAIQFRKALANFDQNNDSNGIRILFSAHSIPENLTYTDTSKAKNPIGDPYKVQVDITVELVIQRMKEIFSLEDFDYIVSYQSKIGPVKWLEPSTESEVLRCIEEKMICIIVPISFVSDNSETLYELDIEYKELFEKIGFEYFLRSDSLNLNNKFLISLKNMIYNSIDNDQKFISSNNFRCEKKFCSCPCNEKL